MKTCTVDDCENLVEGNTDMCASHNSAKRKMERLFKNEQDKRKAILSAPKKVYKAPNKVSPKRQELNKEYFALVEQFKIDNPKCKANVNEYCTENTDDPHHRKGRGVYLLDTTTWLPVCRSCHSYIEAHPQEAKERGWSESRLAKDEPHKI